MQKDYNEIILETIDALISARMAAETRDETLVCTIVDDTYRKDGLYRVSYNDVAIYDAYSESDKYRNRQQVYVLVPKDGEKKLILSKYSDDEVNTPEVYLSEKDVLANLQSVTVPQNTAGYQIEQNGITNSDGAIEIIAEGMPLPADTKNLNTLFISAEFKCPDLEDKTIVAGKYGIQIVGILKNTHEEVVMLFDSSNMVGNPFGWPVFFKQSASFRYNINNDFENLIIKFYTSKDFKTFDGTFQTTVSVRNIEIAFGLDSTQEEDHTVKLLTADSEEYDPRVNSAETKKISLVWYNTNEDGKYLGFSDGTIVNDGEHEDQETYAENYPDDEEDTYYAIKWYLDNLDGSYSELKNWAGKTEMSILCQQNFTKTNVFAHVWCNGVKYESNVITFKNKMAENSPDLQWLGINLKLKNENKSQDGYPIYGYNNILINSAEKNYARSLKFTWESTDGIIEDSFWQGSYLYWYLPANSSMLNPSPSNTKEDGYYVAVGSDKAGFLCYRTKDPLSINSNKKLIEDQIKFYYTIKNQYNSSYINNTIFCKVVKHPNLLLSYAPIMEKDVTNYWAKEYCNLGINNDKKCFELVINAPSIGKTNYILMYQQNIMLNKGTSYTISANYWNNLLFKTQLGQESFRSFRPIFYIRKNGEQTWTILNKFSATRETAQLSEQKFESFTYKYSHTDASGNYDIAFGIYKTGLYKDASGAETEYNKDWGNDKNKNTATFWISSPEVKIDEQGASQFVEGSKSFTFSTFGSSGTDYTLILTPKGMSDVNKNPQVYDIIKEYGWGHDTEKTLFWADLFNKSGDNIYNELEANGIIEKQWVGKDSKTGDAAKIPLGQPYTFTKADLEEYNVIRAVAKGMPWGGAQVDVETLCPVIYSKDSEYEAEVPIYIVYNSFGTLETGDLSPLRLYKKGEIQSNITWELKRFAEDTTFAPQLVQDKETKDVTFRPTTMFFNGVDYRCVLLAKRNDTILWLSPIIIMQNKYSSSILNNWDGSLKIDDENNTVLSAMMVAGKKESKNTFSGVVLGELQRAGESSSYTGLIGYKSGIQCFGFKDNGTAFIGKSGAGRIEFDGDKGFISSPGWTKNKEGEWKLDSTCPAGSVFDLQNGAIHLQKDGDHLILDPEKGLQLSAQTVTSGFSLNSVKDGTTVLLTNIPDDDNETYLKIGTSDHFLSFSRVQGLELKIDSGKIVVENGKTLAEQLADSFVVQVVDPEKNNGFGWTLDGQGFYLQNIVENKVRDIFKCTKDGGEFSGSLTAKETKFTKLQTAPIIINQQKCYSSFENGKIELIVGEPDDSEKSNKGTGGCLHIGSPGYQEWDDVTLWATVIKENLEQQGYGNLGTPQCKWNQLYTYAANVITCNCPSIRGIKQDIQIYNTEQAYEELQNLPLYSFKYNNSQTLSLGTMIDYLPVELMTTSETEDGQLYNLGNIIFWGLSALQCAQQKIQNLSQRLEKLEEKEI